MDGSLRFGAWLKQHRRALGFSREDLARRLSCSVSLVEKMETGERRPSRQIASLLADCFGLPADQHLEFISFARRIPVTSPLLPPDQAFGAALQRPCSNLPPSMTLLIGRQGELTEIAALLDRSDCRLITLIGAGGILAADGRFHLIYDPFHAAEANAVMQQATDQIERHNFTIKAVETKSIAQTTVVCIIAGM